MDLAMNHHEKDRIAAAINVLRPDWPAKSLRTVLDDPKLSGRPRRDVLIALAWVACDSNTKKPGRVHEAGPWWKAAAVEDGIAVKRPPKRDEECQLHLGQYADACSGCAADRLTGTTTRPRTGRDTRVVADGITHVRTALAAVRGGGAEEENHG